MLLGRELGRLQGQHQTWKALRNLPDVLEASRAAAREERGMLGSVRRHRGCLKRRCWLRS